MRDVLLVNGSLPGPTLQGNWGDNFGNFHSVLYMVNVVNVSGSHSCQKQSSYQW